MVPRGELLPTVIVHRGRLFYQGDAEDLKLHCGEAAFAAVNASIDARRNQKLSLDPTILQVRVEAATGMLTWGVVGSGAGGLGIEGR